MSRERFIDPRIWSSEQFCSVSEQAGLLFIGIITTADDHGRRRGSAHSLKLEIMPTRAYSLHDVAGFRGELVAAGLIYHYRGEDMTELVCIPPDNWSKYQKPRWIAKSRLPEYPGAGVIESSQVQAGSVQTCTDSVQTCAGTGRISTDLSKGRGGEGCGGDGRGVEGRGVDSVDVPLQSPCETSPPLTFDVDVPAAAKATATAGNGPSGPGGNGHGSGHGNGASTEEATPDPLAPTPTVPDEPPIREKAKPDTDHEVTETSASIVKRWTASETEFRTMDSLRTYVRQFDRADPVRLLATLRDIETNGTIKHRLRVLHERLRGAKWKEPSEAAIQWAREQLNGPAGAGGAPSSIADVMPEPAATTEPEPPNDPPEAPPPKETPHAILAEFEYLTAGWSSSAHEDAARDVLARVIEVKPDYVLGHCYEINDQDPELRGTTEWRELKVRLLSTESPSDEYLERAQKITLAAGVTA